jgi:hypothetical protein
MNELKLAKAEAAIFQNVKMPAPGASVENSLAGDAYRREIADSLQRVYQQYSACGSLDRRPTIRPSPPSCEVSAMDANAQIKPISRAEFLERSRTCSEVAEAVYSHASALRYVCEQGQQGRSFKVDVEKRNQQYREAAELKVEMLQRELKRYLSSCAPDAKLSQDLTEIGLDALKNEAQQARESWEATRAQTPGAVSTGVSPR